MMSLGCNFIFLLELSKMTTDEKSSSSLNCPRLNGILILHQLVSPFLEMMYPSAYSSLAELWTLKDKSSDKLRRQCFMIEILDNKGAKLIKIKLPGFRSLVKWIHPGTGIHSNAQVPNLKLTLRRAPTKS